VEQKQTKNEAKTESSSSSSSWQPKSGARACGETAPMTMDSAWYKSQEGEDKELLKYFSNLCEGTYLEMGALDGVLFSNSHVFHFGLKWKGLLIEASPINYGNLIKNRKNEIATVHAGVCKERKPLHWVEGKGSAVGGFLEFATPSFRQQWFSEEAIRNAQVVDCKPLKDLLAETVGPRFFFDFFSLDIEGAEYAALASLDFDQVSFGVILVESDAMTSQLKNIAVYSILEANGYVFLKEFKRSYWFINRDFSSIYDHLIYS
jgi:hypothetical protein